MNPILRVEEACAHAVERAFAVAFPSALEPVQVARKLVAVFERDATGRAARYVVQLSAADAERFESERAFLERQWHAMLLGLARRAGRPAALEVQLRATPGTATGTVSIAIEALIATERLVLRVSRGVPQDRRLVLAGNVLVGRDPSCDLTVVDARVSRRHCAIDLHEGTSTLRDLHSSNGTVLNGREIESARVSAGDVIRLGDSELVLEREIAGVAPE